MSNVMVDSTVVVSKFRAALTAGIEGIVQAAEIYVDAIDRDPDMKQVFVYELADILPKSAWSQFEAVGRRRMHPCLILGGMSDAKKLSMVRRLPYSTQEQVFNRTRFPLLVSNNDVLNVDLFEATPEQAAQLCDKTGIRSVAEQKAWLTSRPAVTAETPEPMPYTISAGKVIFRRGVMLTKQEVRRLLQEM